MPRQIVLKKMTPPGMKRLMYTRFSKNGMPEMMSEAKLTKGKHVGLRHAGKKKIGWSPAAVVKIVILIPRF